MSMKTVGLSRGVVAWMLLASLRVLNGAAINKVICRNVDVTSVVVILGYFPI